MVNKKHWVDNLKALGIVAVILGHISSPFGSFIYSWHMPLFFILAGFFIRTELSPKEFVMKEFKRLMIPYFIFAFLAIIAESAKRLLLNREGLDYIHEFIGIFIWMDLESLKNTYAFVLWFLPALFVSRFLVYLILKKVKFQILQFFIIGTTFYISFIGNLPFAIDNALNAVLFVYVGSVFYIFYQDNKILYFLPFLLTGVIFYYGMPILDMSNKLYESVFVNIFWSVSIIYIFILVLKEFDLEVKLLALWGGNTMLLFIIHPYTNNIAHIFVEQIELGGWFLKLAISLLLLHSVLIVKNTYEGRGVFKYV